MKLPLTEEEIHRYARHIVLPEVGGVGQRKLLAAKALVIGAGGLGSAAALYLAAAGVGTIGIVDHDEVDLSNLQRQILHSTKDIGRPKVVSAQERMEALNPGVTVFPHRLRLSAANAAEIIRLYDVVVDGSDNFPTKFLVNDACVMLGIPVMIAGILRFDGQLYPIIPGKGPCYRCLFRQPPPAGLIPSCQEAGVFGAVAGVMGSLQALQAVKLLLGIGEPAAGRIFFFDALPGEFAAIRVSRNPNCPLCGDSPTITELREEGEVCPLA